MREVVSVVLCLVLFNLITVVAGPAHAGTYTFNATQSTQALDGSYAGTNFCTASTMAVGQNSGYTAVSYIQTGFSIPSDQAIVSATLYVFDSVHTTNGNVTVCAVGNWNWNECTLTWNNQPGCPSGGSAWCLANGVGWLAWDVANIVTLWKNGTMPNRGFLLYGASAPYPWCGLATTRFGNSSYRPYLVVETEQLGSCCNNTTGACTMTLQAACGTGSTWHSGSGWTTCSPNPCPLPGACCNPSTGACTLVLQTACTSPLIWNGASSCTPNPCPQLGACCTTAGACTLTLQANCAAPSTWNGTWTTCSPNPCPQLGACCDDTTGACTLTLQMACGTGRTWHSEWTTCSPNSCPEPTGACCNTATWACTVTTAAACTPNLWLGAGTNCSQNPCLQPSGACCNPTTGVCTLTTPDACASPNIWHSEWTTCTPNSCPEATGACCDPTTGACTMVLQSTCTAPLSWNGGSICTPNPCASQVFEDFDDCVSPGWGDEEVCSSLYSHTFTVVNGPAGTGCVLRHEGGLVNGGGNGEAYVPGLQLADVFVQADVWNVAAYHPLAKAQGLTARVNQATGQQYLFWYNVSGQAMLFRMSNWLSCQSLAIATSTPWPLGEKRTMGIRVVGNSLSAFVNGELVVSCVDPDPLGAGTVGVSACAGETYFDNVSASSALGVCCNLAGSCSLVQEAECMAPGTWHGEWTSCTSNPCPQPDGACCTPVGSCSMTKEADCASPSTWQLDWTECTPNPCPQPEGACCGLPGTCAVTSLAACAAPGFWLGVGTVCTPNPCPSQAFENFDDCVSPGWGDAEVCSSAYSHTFTVVNGPAGTGCVLRHEGGIVNGGGNGEAYIPGLQLADVFVQADVWNVAAYHPLAKAQGLAARVNQTTGQQYLFWYNVSGDAVFLKLSNWLSCQTLASATSTPWPLGEKRTIAIRVVGNSLSAFVSGQLVLSCVDPEPLEAGTVGVTASAGETYFDNVSVLSPLSDAPASGPRSSERLFGASPNPFVASTSLWLRLENIGSASLEVFDAGGHCLRAWREIEVGAGSRGFAWDGRDGTGNLVSPGAYFVRLTAGGHSWTQTLVRVR